MNLSLEKASGVNLGCPVCTKSDATSFRRAYDDRYGQPSLFTLIRCRHCQHVMTSPRLQESELGALYSTYYPRKHVDVGELKNNALRSVMSLARLKRWWAGTDNQGQYAVRPGELMLDVGCGSGLSLLEAKALGADVRGIEADPNVRRIADELGLIIHIGSLLDDPFSEEKFDLVVLNQVIEHVPDPSLMLSCLRGRLKKGGRIVLVFPNINSLWCRLSGDRWINWHVPYHLHHFSRNGFERLTERMGYRVRSVRTVTPNLWTVLQVRANRIRVELGKPSSLWSVSAPTTKENSGARQITLRRPMVQWMRSFVRRVILIGMMIPIALVNRLVDAMGLGDSVMIEIAPKETP